MLELLRRTFKDFRDDECPRMAASMSYFTVFSLAPLLVLVLLIVGVFVDPSDIQGRIHAQIAGLIGADGARQIDEMIVAANKPANRGVLPTTLGIVALLFGATGAFGELQSALNRAWGVKPDPRRGGLKSFIGKRVLSLGLVATVAFLLLVSLVVSAALSAFGDVLGVWLGGISGSVIQALQMGVSLVVICALFAVIFKVLPDAEVAWRDVWVGALFTTVLFVAGKYLIGFYLSKTNPGSSFGAAGALAVILVWIYYSGMIVFLGAEFTETWAVERGGGIEPEEGAVRSQVSKGR
jgi:membrane protein